MRHDWKAYGGLPHALRNGGLDMVVMIDMRRDAADEIERLQTELRDAKNDALRLHNDKMNYLTELLSRGIEPPQSQ